VLLAAGLIYWLADFYLFDPMCDSPSNPEAVAEECVERGTPVSG